MNIGFGVVGVQMAKLEVSVGKPTLTTTLSFYAYDFKTKNHNHIHEGSPD